MGSVMDRLRATLRFHGFHHAAAMLHSHDVDTSGALVAWRDYPHCLDSYPARMKRSPQEVENGTQA